MSIKKTVSLKDNNGGSTGNKGSSSKRRKTSRCFSFMEIPMEQGKTLKEMDSKKFKVEIKKWTKAVVAYARQVSDRFGSSRKNDDQELSQHYSS
ncbi:hypothetical protein M5689_020586 [Euphorbia peplus]|nr:hypothetical protein M5689_020586 [Euphorbia peplus]